MKLQKILQSHNKNKKEQQNQILGLNLSFSKNNLWRNVEFRSSTFIKVNMQKIFLSRLLIEEMEKQRILQREKLHNQNYQEFTITKEGNDWYYQCVELIGNLIKYMRTIIFE
ncbi:unnamed protein product [Paramecium octaurelia]|uniref:Uncharacterized protein n=1 Tax=Paramecium octaurelia TaxID=43137 RepID=A0A8S1X563_PAROT|nr:unnamed protein product [Paramecium octaurelia]